MLSSGGNITALTIDRDLVSVVVAESRGGRWYQTGGNEQAGAVDQKDPDALKRAIAKTVKAAGLSADAGGATTDIAVSLSDRFASVGIFTFSDFPESEDDARAIIGLRAKKEFALSEVPRLDYQILGGTGPTKVLVVAIDQKLASAIEKGLDERGIEVGRIGLTSFYLANMLDEKAPSHGNFSVAVVIDGTMTLLIFAGGRLDFYRSKSFKGSFENLARDLRMSFVSYAGGGRNDAAATGREQLLLFTEEFSHDEVEALDAVEGVKIRLVRADDFLESTGVAAATGYSNILRLAAIGACL